MHGENGGEEMFVSEMSVSEKIVDFDLGI